MATAKVETAAETYVRAFYDELNRNATNETINGKEVRVWAGKLGAVFAALDISNNYYSTIRKILLEEGCVQYLQRGTRSYDTVLVLNYPPPEKISSDLLTRGSGDATVQALAHRLDGVEHSARVVENWLGSLGGLNIVEAIKNIELRLAKLEASERGTGGNGKAKKS